VIFLHYTISVIIGAEGGRSGLKYLWGTLFVLAVVFLAIGIYYVSTL